MNMIGLAQISCEILKDGDVPIFMVVLSTPYSLHFNCDHTGIPLSNFCVNFNTIFIWPYVQCQRATGGNPRSSRLPRGAYLHQKFSWLCFGSCGQPLGFCTWCGSFSPGIGRRPLKDSHPNWCGSWKSGTGWRHRAGIRDIMGSHPEHSGTFPEEGCQSHSHHPENSGLEDRLIFQNNVVSSTGVHYQD